VVYGKIADISSFCEFVVWDRVKFQEKGVTFPCDTLVLGKYLGPSIDVGPAMTQHIMKANGEIKEHSTVCSLTAEEYVNTTLYREQEKFLEAIQERWGQKMMVKDWSPDVLNLVSDFLIQRTTIPGKMKMGPHYPNWMMSSLPPKRLRTSLSTLRCFSPLGIPRNLQGSSIRPVYMRSVSLMGELRSWLQMSLLNHLCLV
jgi:hypothetical protein